MIKISKKAIDSKTSWIFNTSSTNNAVFIYSDQEEQAHLTVSHINALFEAGQDTNSISLAFVLDMMLYLQDGYHAFRYRNETDPYPGPPGKHPEAEQIYPALYRVLINGLSKKALYNIGKIDFTKTRHMPDEGERAGQKFCHQVMQDRMEMIPDPEELLIYQYS